MLSFLDVDVLRIGHQRRKILINVQRRSSFKGQSIVAFSVFARTPKSDGMTCCCSPPLVEPYFTVGFRMNFERRGEVRRLARLNGELVVGVLLGSFYHTLFLGVGDIELQAHLVGERVPRSSRTFYLPQLSIYTRHGSKMHTIIGFGGFHHQSTVSKLQEIPMHLLRCAHLRHRRGCQTH